MICTAAKDRVYNSKPKNRRGFVLQALAACHSDVLRAMCAPAPLVMAADRLEGRT